MTPVARLDQFPSSEWFDDLASHAAEAPQLYEALGFANLRLLIEILQPSASKHHFGLVFDGYDVTSVGEIADPASFDAEVTLTGDFDDWREMIENIARNGGADRSHTLNALSIADYPLRVMSVDPIGRDKFFRYAETLQTLFNATGRNSTAPT